MQDPVIKIIIRDASGPVKVQTGPDASDNSLEGFIGYERERKERKSKGKKWKIGRGTRKRVTETEKGNITICGPPSDAPLILSCWSWG